MNNDLFNGSYPMKIGNEEFKASRLTDKDYADLDGYIKARYVADAQKAALLLGPEGREIVKLAMAEVHNSETEVAWGTEIGGNILSSQDGVLHLGYQMILRRHPNVSFKQFEKEAHKDLIGSVRAIDDAFGHFYPSRDEEDVGGSSTENKKSA